MVIFRSTTASPCAALIPVPRWHKQRRGGYQTGEKPVAAALIEPCYRVGRTRRPISGVSIEPATNPNAQDMVHIPACSGDKPSTSCKYWAMKMYTPNMAKLPSAYAAIDALNVGKRNRRKS